MKEVNINLIKSLVDGMEEVFEEIELMKRDSVPNNIIMVELSKLSGIAAYLAAESSAIIKDVNFSMQQMTLENDKVSSLESVINKNNTHGKN